MKKHKQGSKYYENIIISLIQFEVIT